MSDKVILKNSNTLLEEDIYFPPKEQIENGELVLNYSTGKEALFIKNDSDEVIPFRSKTYNIDKINQSIPHINYSKDMPGMANEGDFWIIPSDSSTITFTTSEENQTVKIASKGELFNFIEIEGNSIDLSEGEITFEFKEAGEHAVLLEIRQDSYDLSGLFENCTELTSISEKLFSECAQNTSFERTFSGCTSLKEIPSGLFDSNTLVRTFSHTFYGCSSLASIPSNLFKYNINAESFSHTFANCSSINSEIPLSMFNGLTKVTDFSYTFMGCSKLQGTIPQDTFNQCTSALTFEGTFMNCEGLTGDLSANLFSSSKEATTFENCFYGCKNIQTVKSGIFDLCLKVETFSHLFYECSGLTDIPKYIFSNCTKVYDFTDTFNGCSSLFEVSPRDAVFGVEKPLYERNSNEGYAEVKYFSRCFLGCTNLTDYSDIPADWK